MSSPSLLFSLSASLSLQLPLSDIQNQELLQKAGTKGIETENGLSHVYKRGRDTSLASGPVKTNNWIFLQPKHPDSLSFRTVPEERRRLDGTHGFFGRRKGTVPSDCVRMDQKPYSGAPSVDCEKLYSFARHWNISLVRIYKLNIGSARSGLRFQRSGVVESSQLSHFRVSIVTNATHRQEEQASINSR